MLVNEGTNFTTALYCHHFGSRDVIGHVTHKIRSGWFPIGGPLTPTLYLASLLRY